MKQKIVIKILNNDKDRSKVMQIASDIGGVISVSKKGEDQVEIVGDGIDSVKLTNKIRKKVSRYASLESVEEVKPKEAEKKAEEKKEELLTLFPHVQNYAPPYYVYQTVSDPYPDSGCYIM